MSDCLFCQLIEQKKLNLVYEDDLVVAFPDIEPKAKTHLLLVPKRHIPSVLQMEKQDELLLGHLYTVARQLAEKQMLADSGFRLVVNTGHDSGQTVYHVHMHLLGGQELGGMNQ